MILAGSDDRMRAVLKHFAPLTTEMYPQLIQSAVSAHRNGMPLDEVLAKADSIELVLLQRFSGPQVEQAQ